MRGERRMKITEMFAKNSPVISFEVFPPKSDSGIETIYQTIDQLIPLEPDYISVTYGAAGSTNCQNTIEIASYIKNKWNVESVAHLTCINSSKEIIEQVLSRIKEENIENILALRGDMPQDVPIEKINRRDFTYATDLIKYLKSEHDFAISGACYPEGHIETRNIDLELQHLRQKVDAGASYLITQLFFDNADFFDFLARVRAEGISVPVQAGIMPVLNNRQIKRITELCGARIPAELEEAINKYEDDSEQLAQIGIDYSANQIIELISSGVDGVHIYTMNRPEVAKQIMERINQYLAKRGNSL